jgi:hypothetical protein
MKRFMILRCVVATVVAATLQQAVAFARDSKSDSAVRDKYILSEEPKDAQPVLTTREKAKDKDDVVVVGRIGGRKNPWVKGAAAFSIVDPSLKACSERPGDTCPTPWDYCCEADLSKATLFVTVVDDKTGKTLKEDAREALKLHELDTVVVEGKAQRDKKGNLTIAASKLFVRPADEAQK